MRYLRILPVSVLVIFLFTLSTTAQDDGCPTLVDDALATVGDACAKLGRNEACYGNVDVIATDWEQASLADFEGPGDITPIDRLASLTTMPLDIETNTWGIAMLAVQANLPDTLPGQNVTFVLYGDVQLESEVPPDVQSSAATCTATAAGGVNLRNGPGTHYTIAGGLTNGDAVTANGRNQVADWLRVDLDGSPAWVYAPLVTLDCAAETLTVVEADDPTAGYASPMQAFRFTTGVGQPACAEAPPDGLLVQAPKDTTVKFLINGIELEIGSTAVLTVNDDTLRTSTLDGTVAVTAAGETQTVEPGYQLTIVADQALGEPEPYNYDDVRSAPVDLLPEKISVPVTVPAMVFAWTDTGIQMQAGQSYTVRASGQISVWGVCETQKYEIDAPDIDCSEYIVGPNGGIGSNPNIMPSEFPEHDYPVKNAPIHSLTARIGEGEAFFVGEGGKFVADDTGTLQFRVNDADTPDNDGAFIVVVETGGE